MQTFKDTPGYPDDIDYSKTAKSLVDEFIHGVKQGL